MGLFGSKKIYVSSSVYNLAGDEIDRPDFLKSSLFSAVMNPYNAYLGEVIVQNYLTGPGIMQRSFFNYAVRSDLAGLPTFTVRNSVAIDPAIVSPHIPVAASPVGLENSVQTAEITDGDFTYWAEQWLLENNPTEYATEWVSDYNKTDHEITIQYEGGGTQIVPGGNYDKNKQYIIARFYQSIPTDIQPYVTGFLTSNVLVPPSISGYSLDNTVNTGVVNYTLNQEVEVTKVYSDGSPTTVTTTYPTVPASFDGLDFTYNRVDFVGGDGFSLETSNVEKWYHLFENREVTINSTGFDVVVVNDLGGGDTETVTTNTSGEFLTPIYDWREDTQQTILEAITIDGVRIFIYEIGTGNVALDALQSEVDPGGVPEYYPFIPVRLNNKSMLHVDYATLYAESKKAYKRATKGQSLEDLIIEIEDNPDIGDIDYSYVQWGVSVNVVEPACRRYMYEFFHNLIPHQNTSSADITALKADVASYSLKIVALQAWATAQDNPSDPLYGTPKPPTPQVSDPEMTTVRLQSDHTSLNGFDNRYTWVTIEENNYSGLGKPDAVGGDIWFEAGEVFTWTVQSGIYDRDGNSTISNASKTLKQTYMYKQTSVNTYSRLTIWGMVHNNYIYGGNTVTTTLQDGIDDLSASVFIIPLHAPTVKSLGIKDFTQMSTANTWVVFNSYKIVKKKWYQSFFGMLLAIIAIVVIAAIIAPGAIGGASGAFGTNASVGAAFGLSGTAAVVAGAVTNALAAIVIAQAISVASTTVFGEKWGSIIGAIISFAVSFGIANGFNNLSLSNMVNPQTLLKFSSALANGYTGFVQSNISDINAEMIINQEGYDKAKDDLEELMRSMGFINDLAFNPLALTDSVKGNGSSGLQGSYTPESLDEFINRTTMTGGDIVDFTLSMVTDYAELQQTLPK